MTVLIDPEAASDTAGEWVPGTEGDLHRLLFTLAQRRAQALSRTTSMPISEHATKIASSLGEQTGPHRRATKEDGAVRQYFRVTSGPRGHVLEVYTPGRQADFVKHFIPHNPNEKVATSSHAAKEGEAMKELSRRQAGAALPEFENLSDALLKTDGTALHGPLQRAAEKATNDGRTLDHDSEQELIRTTIEAASATS